MDLILPDGEGSDLIEDIKVFSQNTKVIVLSGEQDIQRRNHLFENGIIEYFSKSTPIKELSTQLIYLIDTLNSNFSKNIVVVDDSKFVLKTITNILETKNYNIITFSRPKKALEYIQNNEDKINLIFSDIEMPQIDGIEFLVKVKKLPEAKNIPTIILSSSNDREVYSRALRNGAVDFIKKPFLVEEILLKTDLHIKQSDSNKKIQDQAKELNEYKKALNSSDIVSKTDAKGIITFVNDKFCEVSGYKREELIGKPQSIVRHPDVPSTIFKDLWSHIKKGKAFKGIFKNKKKNGDEYYVDATITPILDLNGNIKEILGIRHDITDIMNPKKQLLDDIKNMNEPLLILAQINNYKILKEFYSDDARDRFESHFSKELLKFIPKKLNIHKIYILGNGLFGLVKQRKRTPEQLESELLSLERRLNYSDIEFEENKYQIDMLFSFSFGGNNIFDDALVGINQIKKEHKTVINAQNFYKLTQIDARKKLKTLTMIKSALKEKEKVVSFYQPIVSNKTKKAIKYESLIRIIDKKGEILSPFHFMEVAKKTDYYHDLTYRVIKNAVKILDSNDNVNISLNLSSSDIENKNIRNTLLDIISKEKNKGRITFELLEDEETKDITIIQKFIQLAKDIGKVKVSIDDFGSGYSNYERLSLFQPDFIKIDGSLIKDITTNTYNQSVIKSIILFAKENNIKTIAEFVSDEELFEKVKALGIDYSQGYLFGKPEPKII